jgi:hypothetical protein
VPLCERADTIVGANLVTPQCDYDVPSKAAQPQLCPIAQWLKTLGILNIE